MAEGRICDSCGHPNPLGETECLNCQEHIDGLPIVEIPEPQTEAGSVEPAVSAPAPAECRPPEKAEAPIPQQPEPPAPERDIQPKPEPTICLLAGNGQEIKVKDGDEIGREAIGAEYLNSLENNDYVARKHIRVFWRNGAWFLKTLPTKNGTYINDGPRVPIGEERKINPCDEIRLSTIARFVVK